MILSTQGKFLAAVSVSLAIGFAAGVYWATPTAFTIPANYQSKNESSQIDSPAECSTEIVAAPKNRINVDGITAESDQPITIEMEWIGDGRVFDGEGRAVSPGLTTNAAEVAAGMDLKSGTPTVPLPPGSTPGNAAKEGGGGLDFKAIGADAGLWGFGGLGVLFLVGGVALWYFTRNTILALCVGGIGVALISVGLAPELWVWSGLAIGAFGLGWLGIHVWRAMGSAKSAKELTEYDELAHEVTKKLTPEQTKDLKAELPANLRVLFDGLKT